MKQVVWSVTEFSTGASWAVTIAESHDDSILSTLRQLYPAESFGIFSQSVPAFPRVIAQRDGLCHVIDTTEGV